MSNVFVILTKIQVYWINKSFLGTDKEIILCENPFRSFLLFSLDSFSVIIGAFTLFVTIAFISTCVCVHCWTCRSCWGNFWWIASLPLPFFPCLIEKGKDKHRSPDPKNIRCCLYRASLLCFCLVIKTVLFLAMYRRVCACGTL